MRMAVLLCAFVSIVAAPPAEAQQPSGNASIDPEHIFFTEPVKSPVTAITEPVKGSNIPLQLIYVQTRDGLYAPIGLRKPPGNGPFPIILFAHMNGGMGVQWIREWTRNGSWTQEQFLKSGYAVAWMRYRAEVNNSYGTPLEEKKREGRQLLNRGPLEYDDAISIIQYVKTLPYIDPNRVGYLGLSHGGEMLMKITSEYDGLRAGIASEPASGEFLARKSPPRKPGDAPPPETFPAFTEEMQKKATAEARSQINMDVATQRLQSIKTPILVMGRERDHNQAIFRANYELLHEAGKEVEWKSYEHNEHGFIFVRRDEKGVYSPDPVQLQAVKDAIAYFDRYMKKP